VDEKYYLSDKMLIGFKRHKQRHSKKGNGFGFEPLTLDALVSKTVLNSSKFYQTDNYIKTISNSKQNGFRIRKLTPLECFRLQDFPDSFKKVVSNSQLYKQAGNAMSVNMMEEIFKEIKSALET
jgi:DNA (cytosine-5)-methyltransferase 1